MSDSLLSNDDIQAANLTGWRANQDALRTRFATGDFATGLRLVNLIGDAAERAGHHPDVDLRYPHVDISLSTHDAGGVTQHDLDLPRTISDLAAGLGISADSSPSDDAG